MASEEMTLKQALSVAREACELRGAMWRASVDDNLLISSELDCFQECVDAERIDMASIYERAEPIISKLLELMK